MCASIVVGGICGSYQSQDSVNHCVSGEFVCLRNYTWVVHSSGGFSMVNKHGIKFLKKNEHKITTYLNQACNFFLNMPKRF